MEIILIFSTSVRTSMPDTKPERVQITIKPELIDLMGLGDPFPGILSCLSQFTTFFLISSCLLFPSFACMDLGYGVLVSYFSLAALPWHNLIMERTWFQCSVVFPFPFLSIPYPSCFSCPQAWSEHLCGLIQFWSGV